MSYQQKNSSHREDADIDRIVDSSYGFLSDMHGGDTLPRKTGGPTVNVVSWDDRSRALPKEKPKLRYWEPRIKTVRDIPQEHLPPPIKPRQRLSDGAFSSQHQTQSKSNQTNQRFENGNSQNVRIRYDEPKINSPRNQYVPSMSQYDPAPINQYNSASRSQYDSAPRIQYDPASRSQYDYAPRSQYDAAPRNQYAHTLNDQYNSAPRNQYNSAPRSQHVHTLNDQYTSAPRNQYVPAPTSQYDPAPRNQYPTSHHELGSNSQYTPPQKNYYEQTPKSQHVPDPRSQHVPAPKSQYVPTPKPPENWKKPSPLMQSTNDINKKPDDVRARWQEVENPNNQIIPDSVNQLEREDWNRNGSSLLNRTNHYLEAVVKMKHDGKAETVPQQQNNNSKMSKLPEEVERRTVEDTDAYKSEKRKSIAERIDDLNKNVGPPPPPLPPPIPDVATVTINRHTDRPQLSYISQIKNGRETLRSVKKIMDGPDQTNQPEPKNFKEKLTRLLDLQLAGQRRNNPTLYSENNHNNGNPHDRYNTIKTLSKAAMKDKLEVILQDGPPKKPSFRGANDIGGRREPATRLRFAENNAVDRADNRVSRQSSFKHSNSNRNSELSRQPSNAEDYHVCHACGNRNPVPRGLPNNVTDRQKVLMENVFETIKLKGRQSKDSYM